MTHTSPHPPTPDRRTHEPADRRRPPPTPGGRAHPSRTRDSATPGARSDPGAHLDPSRPHQPPPRRDRAHHHPLPRDPAGNLSRDHEDNRDHNQHNRDKSRDQNRETKSRDQSRDTTGETPRSRSIQSTHGPVIPFPWPASDPAEETTKTGRDNISQTGAYRGEWCYHQKTKRGQNRCYHGHIRRVGGTEGQRLRGELAAVLRELLEWAVDNQDKSINPRDKPGKGDAAGKNEEKAA
jgi:hypothetical protein